MTKVIILGNIGRTMVGFRADLIKELVSRGCDVYCFASKYSVSEKKFIFDLGATPVNISLNSKGLNPILDVISLGRLVVLFRKYKADILLSTFVKPVVFGTIAAWLAGVPRRFGMIEGLGIAFTDRGGAKSFSLSLVKWFQSRLYRLALPLLKKVFFLNPDDINELRSVTGLKLSNSILFGPIGLDLGEFPFSEPPSGILQFIFVGRLLKEKGIFEYLAAAERIKKKFPFVKFLILGDVDEGNRWALPKEVLSEAVADGIVDHAGHVKNVSEMLAQSSVFVLPSYREGWSRSTQEALAIGRAIITTDAPGCRDSVVDGWNGYIVKARNVDDLVVAMERFVMNRDLVRIFGYRSHQFAVKNLDSSVINRHLADLLLR